MSTINNGAIVPVKKEPLSPKQLQFCSYVEQVYRLRGEIPTYEAVRETLGFNTRSEYDRMWGDKRVRTYLSGIGIDVERITANTGDVLTPLQLLTINTLLDYNDPRPDHKKLKELGVSSKQFQIWKSDPAFAAYLRARVDKIIGGEQDEVDRALFERARDGDVTAIKYLNELTGKYRPADARGGIDLQFFILKIQEVLTRNLNDQPELLTRIGLELESISNQVASGSAGNYSETIPALPVGTPERIIP